MIRSPRSSGRLALTALALALSLAALAAGAVRPQEAGQASAADDSVLEAQMREIASQLRCPTCRNLSVLDSPSEMAQQMRNLVRERLRAGMTPEEVTAYFVDRYGEWILLKPKASGLNWMVWLLPLLLLGGGAAFVGLTVRRWVKRGREREAALLEGREGEL